MQPLISPIDHESRHNSYRAEDEQLTENTPLLRFPHSEVREVRNSVNTVIISLLLIILLSGVLIGIYLLIVQSNSENVLPPINTPLMLVSASQWNIGKRPVLSMTPFKARRVIVVQTDTEPCHGTKSCAKLLREMESNTTVQSLPYNFLLSSHGETFEALGWHRPSPMFRQYPADLVLAFIGNFTKESPTSAQLDEARDFFTESVSLQHLQSKFSIVGKRTKYVPKYLFQSLSKLPQWDKSISDTD